MLDNQDGDVRVEAWRALKGNAPELRTPDRPEWHDFTDGKLPATWRPSGPWSVVSDPEDPNNQTLSVVSDRDLFHIQSGTSTYRDYRLTYRTRFASPWKPYPQNDNIHFTHGNISLRGDHLTLDDSLIWNVFMLPGNLQNPVVQARQILRDRWQLLIPTADTSCAGSPSQFGPVVITGTFAGRPVR